MRLPNKENEIPKNLQKPKPNKKAKPHKKRWALGFVAFVSLAILILGGTFLFRTYQSLKKVVSTKSDITAAGLKGDLDLATLKGEGEGRVNILLLGEGDQGHAGEGLTDTMMVASIDPKTKDVVMISLPRDLYVKIPGYWWSKINSAHAFAEQDKDGSGPEVAKAVVSDVIGQPIHYFVRVDFTGLKQGVDTLSGIDIYNRSDLNDPDYPCDKNESWSCGFKLKAGFYHMDGTTALKYARCRKGNCGDDFGRAERQQSVAVAMRDQALKLGNILNPTKVSDLITNIGNHLKTDLSFEEIRRLVEIAKKIDSNKIKNKVIDGENENLVKTSNVGEASVVVPIAGVGNYRAIRAFVASYFLDGYVQSEAANVEIRAAGAKPGAVYALSSRLKSLGYNVVKTSMDSNEQSGTKLIDHTSGSKPYTIKYLEKRLGINSTKENRQNGQSSDIIIILGNDYEPKDSN
jgi:LCP family protein required for cell wall assembly